MKKESAATVNPSPQDHPHMQKTDIPVSAPSAETAALIAKGHAMTNPAKHPADYAEDKRETARHEHTHHFTNRAKPADQ